MSEEDYQKLFDELKAYITSTNKQSSDLLIEISDLKIKIYTNENKMQRLKDALSVLFDIVKKDHPTLDLSNFHSLIK